MGLFVENDPDPFFFPNPVDPKRLTGDSGDPKRPDPTGSGSATLL